MIEVYCADLLKFLIHFRWSSSPLSESCGCSSILCSHLFAEVLCRLKFMLNRRLKSSVQGINIIGEALPENDGFSFLLMSAISFLFKTAYSFLHFTLFVSNVTLLHGFNSFLSLTVAFWQTWDFSCFNLGITLSISLFLVAGCVRQVLSNPAQVDLLRCCRGLQRQNTRSHGKALQCRQR